MQGTIDLGSVKDLPSNALKARKIDKETVEKFGVKIEYCQDTGEEKAYYAPLYKDGVLTGYQKRTLPKEIRRVGDTKGTLPFGAHIAGNEGKFIIVTEGVEDCLAVDQMLRQQGKGYRVVSCLGTDGWKHNLEYYEQFDKVVILFDNDPQGKKAAGEFACALESGKARITKWQHQAKDPNDLLYVEEGAKILLNSIFKAEEYRPDGIITGEEVWERMQNYTEPEGIPYPPEWEMLGKKMEKIRRGEISLWTAGTSVGKTSFVRRLKQHVLESSDWKIGEVELEESPEKTWRGMLQFQGRKLLKDMTKEEKREAYEKTYGTQRIFTIDHRSQFGKGETLVSKFNHLHYSLGVDIIFLDHITLAVNEYGDGSSGLADQDRMMNDFLTFVEKTGCHLCIISHLRKVGGGGKSFEQGAVPSLDDLKGSGSLKQISFDIIGVSRNTQHEDEYMRNVSHLHVLKCRETGRTGGADHLYFDRDSMSLIPAELPENNDDL